MRSLVTLVLLMIAPVLCAQPLADADGREIMDAVYERHHHYPHVYEEQSMILIDRNDNRETRKLRRYSRVSEEGVVDFLLLFDSPDEVNGVAVRARKRADGTVEETIYLPAFGRTLVKRVDTASESHITADETFLGTDYSVENIAGEVLDDYTYIRRVDSIQGEAAYFVIDVFPKTEEDVALRHPLRRHYIRQENLYIVRTDLFNNLGRLRKRLTQHDLVAVVGSMWRSNMMLMENFEENHKTIIKIDRRVFSADYVPDEVFTAEWLYSNAPHEEIVIESVPTAEVPVAAANEDPRT